MSPTVLLFRSPTPTSEGPDRFTAAFESHSYHAISVPVLEHAFVNVEPLQSVIRDGPERRYSGVIVTSGRASEGWRHAVEAPSSSDHPTPSISWQHTPFYVVGARTADHLVAPSGSPKTHLYPSPDTILGAAESGNAEKLGRFIIEDVQKRRDPTILPLLYLTGDKSRDTIKTMLDDASVPTQLLQVYETRTSAALKQDIEAAVEEATERAGSKLSSLHIWLVFFAPSSAKPSLPILERFYKLPALKEALDCGRTVPEARIAAIGPTTASYLTEEHQPTSFRVDVTSPSPKPEALALAIRNFDASQVVLA
ncbi:hypothetical protein FRB94_001278 [Tulasnella sp. JGI-2019a]|nr:hypothetical protein FRB94_001278 [Tulasnella sp. JGI-2019a]